MKCESCNISKYEVYAINKSGKPFDSAWLCRDCQGYEYSDSPALHEVVYLKGYGKVSKARLNEMDRRVILPHDVPGGGYYVGRRGDNGKIQEKYPNIQK
jgi:hypothetical protein